MTRARAVSEATEAGGGAEAPPAGGPKRARRIVALAALAAVGLAAGLVRPAFTGRWYGLYVLEAREGIGLELKDDLVLGDGSRLVAGVDFSALRAALHAGEARRLSTWLELEWDEGAGAGLVRNHLPDGTELVTLFSRYADSEGLTPHGLFVGGALPEIAKSTAQNESGMTVRDARGWTHVWCNVNEGMLLEATGELTYPGRWRFLGSRVLVRDPERVVLESSHEISEGGVELRMDRYAYFRAGKPYFKLGIKLTNVGDQPVRYAYTYGDEPWVGEFGSAAGNVGWTASGLVLVERFVDAEAHRWVGILDQDSGVANFLAWLGEDLPDAAYFSNVPGVVSAGEPPLESNEVFVAAQWNDRVLEPGEGRSMLLAIGMADVVDGRPRLPPGAGPRR